MWLFNSLSLILLVCTSAKWKGNYPFEGVLYDVLIELLFSYIRSVVIIIE